MTMIRRQLPVHSPLTLGALAGGALAALGGGDAVHERARAAVSERFRSAEALLTDSGTSALVLALRLAAGEGGTVAFPGYACVDLAAAARFAGLRVRLYDVDPRTLSPDLDSVARALSRGTDAIVVAHLYGYPADVPGVSALADAYGVPVIEDAAQGAGGTLDGSPLGVLGDLAVLSFGRGKGMSAGRGGALLANAPGWRKRVAAMADRLAPGGRGVPGLVTSTAHWALGRPSLYVLPSSIPWLRLGEMVYHPAHEPARISDGAAGMVPFALQAATEERERRVTNARAMVHFANGRERSHGDIGTVREIEGGESGMLRLPLLDRGGRGAAPAIGVLRGYPRTLHEQLELRPSLLDGEPATPGAEELRRTLHTLPSHGMLAERDRAALVRWIEGGNGKARG